MKPALGRSTFPFAIITALILAVPQTRAAAGPKFESKVITVDTPGNAVPVEVDISGAKNLYLVVADGGNGFSCDWADWAEPRLIGANGKELPLTELKWKSARADWGEVRVNRNADGGPLRIEGRPVEYGIGTHANSVIHFELPEGYTKFKARAGLDNGGTDQNGGASVQFFVFLEPPPQGLAQGSSPDAGGRSPEHALDGLEVADGLEATLFAAEPMLHSPSNIDVDHRGRVWVCEVVNYRQFRNQEIPYREEGDRILILEDTNGDGRADSVKTFYQGTDIDSAHGICVLGNRVIVSAGDSVFLFVDENGDDQPDRKDVLFTGISGVQHDHGIHAFVFGPDGKLYFNFGNEGKQLKDKHGRPVVDKAGNEVKADRSPYQEGMVFRCNLDGSEVETLGWNFRNNWEVAVDSFGTLWQSDNDDDGNRGVRINYVMEFGNYGYKDELTGAGWREPRTNLEDEIPLQHWHLNDPGVVPNLLQTGAGSPTGMCIYEGSLLPEVFRGEMIHCDAGPNIVRAYPVEKDGAGYSARIVNVLEGVRDKWFRPSDVCVAPDGSLIIADWYDPGVGGHRAQDINSGRIFRLAPPGTAYKIPKFDVSTPESAVEALKSPNLATRYLAWTALHQMQQKAEPALLELYRDQNPRFRARALWLLAKIKGRGLEHLQRAVEDRDPAIRITALRAVRQIQRELQTISATESSGRKQIKIGPRDVLTVFVEKLVRDPSPHVRRECAIALRHSDSPAAAHLRTELALQHDGKDRWYLEALGIGADLQWDRFFEAWLAKVHDDWNGPAGRDIVWRSRSPEAMPLLAKLIVDERTEPTERLRYFRAFDFHQHESRQNQERKRQILIELAKAEPRGLSGEAELEIRLLALKHLGRVHLGETPDLKKSLNRALDAVRGTPRFIEMVQQFQVSDRFPELLEMAQQNPDSQLGVDAIRTLLASEQVRLLTQAFRSGDGEVALNTARVLGNSGDSRAAGLLIRMLNESEQPIELRREIVRALAKSRNGAMRLMNQASEGRLDSSLKAVAAASLHSAQWPDVKERANQLFPLPPGKDDKPLPPIDELVKRKGDPVRGRIVFNTTGTCVQCHVVDGLGKEVGPNLTEIGDKLSRHAFFESILFPSAGISHNYENYILALDSGNVFNGVLVSQTPDEITIKGADAIARTFKTSEIIQMKKQDVSLMPADLQKVMSAEDLVNVVEYMTTLKKASASE